MTSTTRRLDGPALLAAIGLIFADGAVAEAHPAASASAAPPPASAPPTGHHAPPPPGAERRGAVYDDQAQWYDRDYAQRYAEWAAQNCIDQRTNALAGAAIGGVMGAILGSSLSERRDPAAGAIIGGALGAAAGAAVGSGGGSQCPPGYIVRPGAPAFVHASPGTRAYPPDVIHGPPWYNPWVWTGGVWVFRPYRYWYWHNHHYWRPGFRPGPWVYRYRRW
jgi:hypothetical protein